MINRNPLWNGALGQSYAVISVALIINFNFLQLTNFMEESPKRIQIL